MERRPWEAPAVEIDPSLLVPIEGSLVELDCSVLHADGTGSFTSPIWRPEPAVQVALPPPPRLPSLPPPPSLPSLPSLPPVPSLPSLARPPSLPSLPARVALPPMPTPPPVSSTFDAPPSRPAWLDTERPKRAEKPKPEPARASEETRPNVRLARPAAPAANPEPERRTLLDPAGPSIRPAAWSIPAPAPRSRARTLGARAAGVGIGAGVLLFACAWLVATPSAASATARGVITVTDAEGIALRAVHVHVDGLLSCETTPCSVEVEPGTHQIDVLNLLTDQRSGRSVNLAKGERAALHFALPSKPSPRRAASQSPPPEVAAAPTPGFDEPISVTSLAQELLPEAAETPKKSAPGPMAAPRTAGGAFLNLNSIPISSVVLDGRPMGNTPLVGVQVSPGTHNVTFVHPTYGRRSANIETSFGQRKAVVVRFQRKARALEE